MLYQKFLEDYGIFVQIINKKKWILYLIKHVKMLMMSLRGVPHLPLSSNHQIRMTLLK